MQHRKSPGGSHLKELPGFSVGEGEGLGALPAELQHGAIGLWGLEGGGREGGGGNVRRRESREDKGVREREREG